MQETGSIPGSGRAPGGGDASILAREIPRTARSVQLHTAHGVAESDTTEQLSTQNRKEDSY